MKRVEFLEILTRDRKIAAKLRRRAISKRIVAIAMILLGLLVIYTLIQSLYWGVFLGNDKKNYWGMIFIGGWFISIIGLVITDSYNPLSRLGNFNNQFFVLIELVISEIEKNKRLSYKFNELLLLFKRYLYKMDTHAKSLYIFESNEITLVTSKLANIPSSKFRSIIEHNKDLSLGFFTSLNSLYECKINERPYNENEYELLVQYIDQINNYEPVKPSKAKRNFQLLEIIQRKKKIVIISLIVIFGLFGLALKLLGMSDSKYIDFFMYTITIISAILTVLSLRDKD
ncbi:hypothetical protein [Paenibacillus ihuae]|uniref:hypothetical protein n=1 Tax=Paenibacillus ihuae TaxID=1232431 RepID=UPI0006D5A18F|nr:hypothetical protein [Paenibacillus ihuae]